MDVKKKLSGLEPAGIFSFFEDICMIPHGSGNSGQIGDYLLDFGRRRGIKAYRDEAGNVKMFLDASEGYEDREPILLQSHMDMVCQKIPESDHNFEKDPLNLVIDGDYIKASGTTLGGDDGIGVAAMLAVLDDNRLLHGPIECLFTVDEETGMDGAIAVDLSDFKSFKMLNLDSENLDEIVAGCAGGVTAEIKLKLDRHPVSDTRGREPAFYKLTVSGVTGGHSGDEIYKQGANAARLACRLVNDLKTSDGALEGNWNVQLVSIRGGDKQNVITQQAYCVVSCNENLNEAAFMGEIAGLAEIYRKEYASTDRNLTINAEPCPGEVMGPVTSETYDSVLAILNGTPYGVQRMDPYLENTVETSVNTGIVSHIKEAGEEYLYVNMLVRSSVASRKRELAQRIGSVARAAGAEFRLSSRYPEWEYRRDGAFVQYVAECLEKERGRKPLVTAIHGGLECGLILEKRPEMEIASIGPDIFDIHTPGERLSITSTGEFYRALCRILSAV